MLNIKIHRSIRHRTQASVRPLLAKAAREEGDLSTPPEGSSSQAKIAFVEQLQKFNMD
jgi:hypothetical protein